MKYLYVLVGSKKGFYCEQTLVSMVSLKKISPKAFISLLVDEQTDQEYKSEISNIKKYVDEYIIVPIKKELPSTAKSRFMKTTMREYLKGDFLYVDADTIWCAPVDENDFSNDVMGVLDGHCLLNDHPLKKRIKEDFAKTNCNPDVEKYINGGVLFSKDSETSRIFFDLWHEKWKETSLNGCFIDMPSLNYAIKKIGDAFSILPDVYNVQISRSWKYFANAKLVHFFTGWTDEYFESPYLFQKKRFWTAIRDNGIDEMATSAIENPRSAFDNSFVICGKEELDFHNTALYGFVADLYARRRERKTFYFLNEIVKKISKMWH